MAREIKDIIASARYDVEDVDGCAVTATIIRTEDLLALCNAAEKVPLLEALLEDACERLMGEDL